MNSQRTPSGQAPYRLLYLETSFGDLIWRAHLESSFGETIGLTVESKQTHSGRSTNFQQAPNRLLYLETSFGDLIWRAHLKSSFGETIGLSADSQHSVESKQAIGSKNIILAIY